MVDQVWDKETEVDYKGRTVVVRIGKKELLDNGWVEFGAKSEDETFVEVFGKNPIPIAVKPKQVFKADYDLFQNTPEQIAMGEQIWNSIQRLYF